MKRSAAQPADAAAKREKLFSGLRIHFVPRQIGPVQLEILKKNVTRHGGSVVEELGLNRVDIVIANVEYMKLIDLLQQSQKKPASTDSFSLSISSVPSTVRIHRPEWITESLQRGALLSADDHCVSPASAAPRRGNSFPMASPPSTGFSATGPAVYSSTSVHALLDRTVAAVVPTPPPSIRSGDAPSPLQRGRTTIVQTSTAVPRKHRARPGRAPSSSSRSSSAGSLSFSSSPSMSAASSGLSKFISASRFDSEAVATHTAASHDSGRPPTASSPSPSTSVTTTSTATAAVAATAGAKDGLPLSSPQLRGAPADPTAKSIYSTQIVPLSLSSPKRRKIDDDSAQDDASAAPVSSVFSAAALRSTTACDARGSTTSVTVASTSAPLWRSKSLDWMPPPSTVEPPAPVSSWLAYAIDDVDGGAGASDGNDSAGVIRSRVADLDFEFAVPSGAPRVRDLASFVNFSQSQPGMADDDIDNYGDDGDELQRTSGRRKTFSTFGAADDEEDGGGRALVPRSLAKLHHRKAAMRALLQSIVDSEEDSTPSTPSPAVAAPGTIDPSLTSQSHFLRVADHDRRQRPRKGPSLADEDGVSGSKVEAQEVDDVAYGDEAAEDDGLGDLLLRHELRRSSSLSAFASHVPPRTNYNKKSYDSSDDESDVEAERHHHRAHSDSDEEPSEEFFHDTTQMAKHNRFFNGSYKEYLPSVSEREQVLRTKRREFFVCQKGPEAPTTNHNKHITDVLETLEQTCRNSGDRWREYAYRKAVQILKSRPERIESADQARKLRGIGSRIAEKIAEILETGTLRKAELQRNDEMTQTFALFGNVFGAGPSTIQKWYAQGFRTLEDLATKANLTHQQRVGVQYYHEFLARMSRDEVARIAARITQVIHSMDLDYIVEVCGSYRRLKPDCGDMDILVTHPKHIKLHGFLATSIPLLRDAGIITDELTSSSKSPSQDKFLGVCWNGAGLHRRIDIQCVPLEEWPFALLYFTGSGHFNRSMRLWARRHGFSLSEHSLVRRFANDLKGDPILGIKTEREIFDALGLEYKAPHERDV